MPQTSSYQVKPPRCCSSPLLVLGLLAVLALLVTAVTCGLAVRNPLMPRRKWAKEGFTAPRWRTIHSFVLPLPGRDDRLLVGSFRQAGSRDLLVLHNGMATILEPDGTSHPSPRLPVDYMTDWIKAWDYNGDGISELVFNQADPANGISAPTVVDLSGRKLASFPGDNVEYGLDPCDFDGDGVQDLLLGTWSVYGAQGKLIYEIGPGDLSPDRRVVKSLKSEFGNYVVSFTSGDTDGDGILELIVGSHANKALVPFNKAPVIVDWPAMNPVLCHDFDGDGKDEVVSEYEGIYSPRDAQLHAFREDDLKDSLSGDTLFMIAWRPPSADRDVLLRSNGGHLLQIFSDQAELLYEEDLGENVQGIVRLANNNVEYAGVLTSARVLICP